MRNFVNLLLPERVAQTIKQEVRAGNFATANEFVGHLVRLWNTHKLGEELRKDRKEFEQGKGKQLRALRDLR